jgi:uncharacterized repeat protein (TIGR01451 family)
VANDGAQQGAESGVAGVRLRLAAAACAGGMCDSALTDGAGDYSLWVPLAATGAAVSVAESNAAGWLSTGGSAGATGGVYSRAADATSFTPVAGVIATGLDFGDVPLNSFVAPGAQVVFPGGFASYAHRFTAWSAGNVTFSSTQTPTPAVPGWALTIVHDLDCNGVADPGEPVVSGSLPLTAGQQICLIARHVSPAGAPVGAGELAALSASFSYSGATPALSDDRTLDDVTTVVAHGLMIRKTVSQASARPGDSLTYDIEYTNVSAQPLSGIVIHDATPAYTTFTSAGCGTLGGGLTGCSVAVAPLAGGPGPLHWALAGSLGPGATGTVSFTVRVQ